MNSKITVSLICLISACSWLNACEESLCRISLTENASANSIAAYNEERDKDAVASLLQNNPYKLSFTSQEQLACFFRNDIKITDEDKKSPVGTSVHVNYTDTFAAKVILKQEANNERRVVGLICYSLSTIKEPMPCIMGTIPFCIAENSALEKELFMDVLNEFNGKKGIVICAHSHTNNEIQKATLQQLGFTCVSQNPANPQTGAASNINMYMIIKPAESALDDQAKSERSDSQSIVKHATKETVESEIKQSKLPVILDLYSTWCPPCKQLAPIIEELANEMNGICVFVKYNVDVPCDFIAALGKEYNIRGIPTLFFINDGQVKGVFTGYLSKSALKAKITEYLS